MLSRNLLCGAAAILCVALMGCQKPAADTAAPVAAKADSAGTSQATQAAAKDAYLFGYPLVLMDVSRAKAVNVPNPTAGSSAPTNQFSHVTRFPDANFFDVVSPNADTLYSTAWLDLGKEPIVLSVPDTKGRFYLMPMLDGWTNVFASPGKRTTGTGKGDFAITGPRWTGELPAGMQQIKAPTEMVWILGRTQTNGAADFDAVHALQAQYKLTPLSAWGKPYTPPKDVPTDPNVDMKAAPVDTVAAMDATTVFNRLATLMQNNPPAADDAPMVEKLASLGIKPGQPFAPDAASAQAIADGVADAKTALPELGHHLPGAKMVNGWTLKLEGMGTYGTDYPTRAGVAWVGLGANLVEDALYPRSQVDGDGQPLDGAHTYMVHFEMGETPPANAFWSLTMYNDKQFFIANPIDRFAIGDRDKLKTNPDGSTDIWIQRESPGKDKESNWLPAPEGPFNVIMRMYWPKEAVTSGAWTPPPIVRTDK
jgi:hypothetical protein